jgi:hypothetical protein
MRETSTVAFDANGHDFGRVKEVAVVTSSYGGVKSVMTPLSSCGYCDAYPLVEFEDDLVRVEAPCELPDGVTTVTEVDFPSGKVLVSDDLRPVFDVDDAEMANYNSSLGQSQFVKAMARIGCAYGPVLNTSPGLYRTGEGTFVIANPEYDEGTDTELDFGAELLAEVSTSLWAYSIADYELWRSLGGDPSTLEASDTVVEIPPGRYRFTLHSAEAGFDHHDPGLVVFAHVERVS